MKEFRYKLKFDLINDYIQLSAVDKFNQNDGYNSAFVLNNMTDIELLLKNMNTCLYEVIHRIIRDDKWDFFNPEKLAEDKSKELNAWYPN